MFAPYFLEPLSFAFIVAENMDGIILAEPPVELMEEFAALCIGHLPFRRAIRQRAIDAISGSVSVRQQTVICLCCRCP